MNRETPTADDSYDDYVWQCVTWSRNGGCKLRALASRLSGVMRVLGMMSGTSADGIDVALVRIAGAPPSLSVKFEGHHHVRFPARVRAAILRLANGEMTTTAEISQLNFLLGEEFAAAAV